MSTDEGGGMTEEGGGGMNGSSSVGKGMNEEGSMKGEMRLSLEDEGDDGGDGMRMDEGGGMTDGMRMRAGSMRLDEGGGMTEQGGGMRMDEGDGGGMREGGDENGLSAAWNSALTGNPKQVIFLDHTEVFFVHNIKLNCHHDSIFVFEIN